MRDPGTRFSIVVCAFAPLFAVLLSTMPAWAQGQTVTAMWDASPPADQVTGYQVCIGTSSLSCNVTLANANASQTSYAFSPAPGVLHYVATRAINASGAGAYSSEVTFSIPGFAQPLNQSNSVGVAIAGLNLNVSDPDGSSLTFTHTGLPPGLTLNSTTGRITGSPSAAGTYNVTVFAADNLVTVSRSWVWTVTSSSSDIQAPTLAITSHTAGQTLTVAGITLSGTATDSGRGGSGITGVKVNGVVIAGATASGSNSVNWSRSITLVSGANTITVEATDGAGNVNMQQLTLNLNAPIAPVTAATITANLSSPRNTGTAITFTAAGSGGVAPRQYKFLVAQGGGTAQTVQNWSTTATYAWTPSTAANYTVTVWARSAGVTTDAPQASAQVVYSITASVSGVNVVSVTPASGSGSSQTFALQYSNSGGATNFRQVWVWFNATLAANSANSCLLLYDLPSATVKLVNDEARTWMPGVLGTNAVLQNSQCSVALAGSSVSLSGTSLTLNLAISFSSGYSGGKNVYLYGLNAAGANSGWQDRGDWTVPASAPPVITPSGPVSAVSVTPSSGSGSTQTFALQYSNSTGATSLKTAWAWFNPTFGTNSANSCLVKYERTGRLNLLNDAATVWTSGSIGGSGTLQNNQCSIALAGSSVSLSGTTLTLNLAMTFKSAYGGAKNVYLYADNSAGATSGWQDRGDWTVPTSTPTPAPGGVTAVSATPSSGSGLTQTFTLQYADGGGAANLQTAWVWFSAAFTPTASSANSCLVKYDRVSRRVSLVNNAATSWTSGVIGTSGTLQNSQCSVALASSSATLSGTTLTLNLAVTFKSAFAGAKNIYLYADNARGANSGWQDRGDWTAN